MRKNILTVLLCMIILLIVSGCQNQDSAPPQEMTDAVKASDAWLSKFTSPGPEVENFWGLLSIKAIWGPSCPVSRISNSMQFQFLPALPPHTYQTRYTCWIDGEALNGDSITISLDIVAIVTLAPDGREWQIQSYEFRNEKTLTFWDQLFTWLLWIYILPIGILVILTTLFYNFGFGNIFSFKIIWNIARFILGILILPWVGWVSFLCFNTQIAIAVGIIAYLAIYFLLVGKVLNQRMKPYAMCI